MEQKKVGTFYGVLVPNITMMLGVILFLRLGIIVGSSGIFQMSSVILLSLGFMVITSLSIASIATNMNMGGGGVYYLITRSLGIEIGGTVGLALYFSQIISLTLTVTGFSYTLCDMFPSLSIVAVEVATLLVLGLISSASSNAALKLQVLILVVLLAGVASVFLGSMENVTPQKEFLPAFSGGLTFWETFAFFYPALTGIEAGMAMSGILRKPGRSLFIGNIAGVVFCALLYLALSIFAYLSIPNSYLVSDPFIFVSFAKSESLVRLGILTATISSALGSVLGAPRILESMAKDGLMPSIFGKVYGAYSEPRWALVLTLILATITAIYTKIDQIIPILTMVCLISYGLLNLVSGLGELMNTASWRPSVRVPWWLSMFGFLMSIVIMLFVNLTWTFIALILFVSFFFLIQGRKLEAGFQDFRDSMIFFFSRTALYHLGAPAENALVWHPQLLVMATGLSQQRKLAFLSHQLTCRSGLLTFAAVVPSTWQDPEQIQSSKSSLEAYLEKENISGLVEVIPADSNFDGQLALIRAYGIGAIQPNTIVLALPDPEEFEKLVEIIEACRTMRKNLVLFRDSEKVPEELYVEEEEKTVDLWWNGDDRNGFDLAVSLTTAIRDHKVWSYGKYHLRSIVGSRSAKGVMQRFFKEFVMRSRIPFEPIVSLETKASDYMPYVAQYSANAHLTVLTLRPFTEDDDSTNYIEYLKQVVEQTKTLKDCLFITSYDDVEHKEIYHYPGR